LFAQHDVVEGIAIVESLVEELPVTSSYDLVLAEGLIVIQTDPAAFAQRIAQFAKPGGIVVLTCSDAVSVFAEAGRRLIAGRVAPADMDLDRRMSILRSLFTPHLTTLAAMSRPIDDWILDNIIQPFGDGKLFSMSDAIEGLEADFDVYGSSPRFLTDWRWYKEVANVERGFNELARRNYGESVLNLLDHRFVHERQPAAFGQALLAHCQVFYELMLQLETGSDVWREINVCLVEIADVVLPVAPETCESIQSLREFLFAARPDTCQLEAFAPFFGRGLQYMSFVRRAEDGDTCLVH
jgi:SAM-dependent methyltransferase